MVVGEPAATVWPAMFQMCGHTADALVVAGLFPLDRVKKIRAGSGLLDMAQDCLDLATLFFQYARKQTLVRLTIRLKKQRL